MAEPSPEIAHRVRHMRGMAQQAWDRGLFFFYVRIPEPLYPEERGEKYEEPLPCDEMPKKRKQKNRSHLCETYFAALM